MIDPDRHIAATKTFLRLTAERRLEESQRFVAESVEFVFPNGTFGDLRDVFAVGERRYRWIRKRHATWDVADPGDGTVVVVSAGTLYGENNAGVPFEGVRYIDRITFRDEKVVRQEVWNDLTESGVLESGGRVEPARDDRTEQHEQERR